MSALQKHSGRAWALSAVLLLACGDKNFILPPENPHRVFLSVPERDFVGAFVPLTVKVEGCSQILEAQVLQGNSPVEGKLHFENNTAHLQLPSQAFEPFYPELGIAVPLSLKARVMCENGQVRDSLPENVSFFPAASVVEYGNRSAFLESFIAIAGTPAASFLGCTRPPGEFGHFLEHFDAQAQLLQKIPMPHAHIHCNAHTRLGEALNGYRWVYTPGNACSLLVLEDRGVASRPDERFVPKADFYASGTQTCSLPAFQSEGDAWMAIWEGGHYRVLRLGAEGEGLKGESEAFFIGIFSVVAFPTPPLLVEERDTLLMTLWTVPYASRVGRLELIAFDVSGHTPLPRCIPGNNCPTVSLPLGDSPANAAPAAVFSKDGTRLYVSQKNDYNHFFVVAYNLLQVAGPLLPQAYSAGPFDNPLTQLSLSGEGHFLVASELESTYFISTTPSSEGKLPVLGERLTVSKGLYVSEHIHGPEGSFILLASPVYQGKFGWPLEALAVDKPEWGELWRFKHSGEGQTPLSALSVSFDEGGQVWMRAGSKLVQPLRKEAYRQARTP